MPYNLSNKSFGLSISLITIAPNSLLNSICKFFSSGLYSFFNFFTTICANIFGQPVVVQTLIVLTRLDASNTIFNCASALSFALPDLIFFLCDYSRSSAFSKALYTISDVGMFTCVSKPTSNIFTLA